MFYEVTTPSGSSIVQADSSRQAKVMLCRKMRIRPSDYLRGVSSMQARKLNIEFPDTVYRPLYDEESLQRFVGRDVVIYDEHHGISTRIKAATVETIRYFLDEYSAVIAL